MMTITNNKIYRGIRCISNFDVCFDGYLYYNYDSGINTPQNINQAKRILNHIKR